MESNASLKAAAVAMINSVSQWKKFRKDKVLPTLRQLDTDFTHQWVGVNIAKTTTAGLAVGSAVMLFVFPPVGIGLGIGAAVTGVGTGVGDWIAEKVKQGWFQDTMKEDDTNTKKMLECAQQFQSELEAAAQSQDLSIEEVLRGLNRALPDTFWQTLAEVSSATGNLVGGISGATFGIVQLVKLAEMSDEILFLAQGARVSVTAGVELVGAGVNGTKVVATTGAKIFGTVGAVVSVLDAAYSWATSKNVQLEIRKCIGDVEKAVDGIERHFAAQ